MLHIIIHMFDLHVVYRQFGNVPAYNLIVLDVLFLVFIDDLQGLTQNSFASFDLRLHRLVTLTHLVFKIDPIGLDLLS